MSSESPTCDHCGARLATLACPNCFHMMFQGAKFCPHCAAPAVTWEASASNLHCPGCDEVLFRGELKQSILHQCGKCFGFWVDRDTFERICRDAEVQAVLPAPTDSAEPAADAPLPKVRYVKCPSCRTLMHRVNFAECSGVVVDVCRAHGTWFDAHELQGVVQFIRAGGLDRSRERKKAELAAQQRRIQSARQFSAPDDVSPEVAPRWEIQFDGLPTVIELIGRLLTRRGR